jgi:hypothetical protein
LWPSVGKFCQVAAHLIKVSTGDHHSTVDEPARFLDLEAVTASEVVRRSYAGLIASLCGRRRGCVAHGVSLCSEVCTTSTAQLRPNLPFPVHADHHEGFPSACLSGVRLAALRRFPDHHAITLAEPEVTLQKH